MFYTYSIKNIENSKFYIGSRTANCMLNIKPEDDLGVRYFSSSNDNELRQAIKDGEIKEMCKTNVTKYHPDWIIVE